MRSHSVLLSIEMMRYHSLLWITEMMMSHSVLASANVLSSTRVLRIIRHFDKITVSLSNNIQDYERH